MSHSLPQFGGGQSPLCLESCNTVTGWPPQNQTGSRIQCSCDKYHEELKSFCQEDLMFYNFLALEACLFLEQFCHQFSGNYSNQNKVGIFSVSASASLCLSHLSLSQPLPQPPQPQPQCFFAQLPVSKRKSKLKNWQHMYLLSLSTVPIYERC